MTRRLVIECGVAQTRATYFVDDEPLAFWFGHAREDAALPRSPEPGDVFLGRVRAVSPNLRGAFIDIGERADGWLPLAKGETPAPEGALVVLGVWRSPIGEKGAVLGSDWRAGLSPADIGAVDAAARTGAPRLMNRGTDPALGALGAFSGPINEVIVDSAATASPLRGSQIGSSARIIDDIEVTREIDAAIDAALERTVAFGGGARLAFDETEGGAVVDIDAGAAVAASANLNDRVNMAAAGVLFRELSRRGIGGRIIIDFLPPRSGKARTALVGALARASKQHGNECRLGLLSVDGLFEMTAPRRRLSLLELASERDGTAPRPGRRFTLDWSAKDAMSKLETLLRHRPKSKPRLLVGAEIAAYLDRQRPQWRGRLEEKYGARFAIAASDKLEARSHDLAE